MYVDNKSTQSRLVLSCALFHSLYQRKSFNIKTGFVLFHTVQLHFKLIAKSYYNCSINLPPVCKLFFVQSTLCCVQAIFRTLCKLFLRTLRMMCTNVPESPRQQRERLCVVLHHFLHLVRYILQQKQSSTTNYTEIASAFLPAYTVSDKK